MKAFTRILALVVVLAMALTLTAMAEPSMQYTVAIMDPYVMVGGAKMLDLKGVDLELTASVTDRDLLGLSLNAFIGDNSDFLAGVDCQLDGNLFTLYLDGMTNSYSVDLATEGVDVTSVLSQVPLMTALMTADPNASAAPDFLLTDLTFEARAAIIESLFDGVMQPAGGNDYTIHVTEGNSRAFLLGIIEGLRQANVQLAQQGMDISEAIAVIRKLSYTLDGTITRTPSSITMNLEGKLMMDGESTDVPVAIEYTDKWGTGNCKITFTNPEDSSETIDITFWLGTATVGFDVWSMGEQLMYFSYDELTTATGGLVHKTSVTYDGNQTISVTTVSNTVADKPSTRIELTADTYGVSGTATLDYVEQEHYVNNGSNVTMGTLEINVSDNRSNFSGGIGMTIGTIDNAADSSEWVISAPAVDAMTASSAQQEQAAREAQAIVEDAVATLSQTLPQLQMLMALVGM